MNNIDDQEGYYKLNLHSFPPSFILLPPRERETLGTSLQQPPQRHQVVLNCFYGYLID